MGDRANVVIKTGADVVSLYTHWGGEELPGIVRDALKRGKSRWDDSQYLARIIFSEMIQNDIMGTTGFGISSSIHDGADRVIVINVDEQTVIGFKGKTHTVEGYANA